MLGYRRWVRMRLTVRCRRQPCLHHPDRTESQPEISVKASLWDQYGASYENGDDRIKVRFWIDDDPHFEEQVETRDGVTGATLSVDKGAARWTTEVRADPGETM